MRSQQFTTISPRTGSSVPYGKPSRPGVFSRTLPWLFGTFGVLLIATAGTTALMPELPAAAEPVLDVLDRAGLDKGPLAMLGCRRDLRRSGDPGARVPRPGGAGA